MKTPDSHKPDPPAVETDPRFPSGPWTGFWIQGGLGKQTMRLSLGFADGKITGRGVDRVGRFTFNGDYDLKTGRCVMTKQYEQAHRVHYDGVNQNDGLWLWGIWSMSHDRGGFHLWPVGEEDPTRRDLKAEKTATRSARPPKQKEKEKEEGELVEV